ncbi:MAG: SulP family inorganic anion transporter [Rubrivivax sp.]|nr:SulP family inorganic anion transporter [Rubrivivax sp.]
MSTAPAKEGRWRRHFDWWAEVDGATLRADLQAALLAAVLVLPQGVAYAALAGLPLAWGLYAAVVPTAVAALAGSSRHVLTGPTNAVSLLLAASLAPLAVVGSAEYLRLALVLTLMVGALQLALALSRLGALTHFISPSVLLGFTGGAAVLIAAHALQALWATAVPRLPGLAVAGLTLAAAVLLRWRWRRGPGLLLALLAGTGLALAAGWALPSIGALPSALPPFAPPTVAGNDFARLATAALALTIVALGQSIAVAKALAQRSGQALDVNRECLGQGLANLAGGLCQGFVGCGSINRSMPHLDAGARTPLAGVLAAACVVVLVALAGPLLARVPLAAVDALLLVVAWTLLDRVQWRDLVRQDRAEAAVAVGTAVATVLLPMPVAVLSGVAASLVLYLNRTAHPALRSMGFAAPPQPGVQRPFVVLSAGAPECPQLKLLRMEGPVWFGAEAHVADALRSLREGDDAPRHLLVMSKSMNFLDPAGVALWERERALRVALGGGLYFHRPRPEVLAAWQRSGFVERLGPAHLFADKRSAIAALVPRLDGERCARCRARVFEECAAQPAPPPTGA